MRLTDFKVLTFDCYGTLIDWETGILNALRPLLRKDPVERHREAVLASFARHETAQEAETPDMIYSELLGPSPPPARRGMGGCRERDRPPRFRCLGGRLAGFR